MLCPLLELGDDLLGLIIKASCATRLPDREVTERAGTPGPPTRPGASLRLSCKALKQTVDTHNTSLELLGRAPGTGAGSEKTQLHEDAFRGLTVKLVHKTPSLTSLTLGRVWSPWSLPVFDLSALPAALSHPSSLQRLFYHGDPMASVEEDLSPLSICIGLKELDLSGTKVADLGPLASLEGSLETLRLEECPIQDLQPIASLRLRCLWLTSTSVCSEFSGLAPLSSQTALEDLGLCSCRMVRDLSPLSNCISRRELDVDWTSVTGLSPLATIGGSLKVLRARGCHIEDLQPIVPLRLTLLLLTSDGISSLDPLSLPTTLEDLGLASKNPTMLTMERDFTALSACTNLRRLDLSGTEILNLEPLSPLTNLRRLDLSITDFSDLSPLSSCTNLEALDLSFCCHVTSLTPLSSCPKLELLNLYYCKLTSLAPLASCPSLKELYVSRCPLDSLAPLASCACLRALNLDRVESIRDLQPLAGLVHLEELVLLSTGVSDLNPLAGLTNLRELNVTNAEVSDLRILRGLPLLRRLSCCPSLAAANLSLLASCPSLEFLMLWELDPSEEVGKRVLADLSVCIPHLKASADDVLMYMGKSNFTA